LGFLVAAGYSSPAEVLKFWMSSQSRAHILDKKFTEVGIGYVHKSGSPDGHYWVMVLGGGEPQVGATVIKSERTLAESRIELLSFTNKNRQTALVFSKPLIQVAQSHANQMSKSGLEGDLPLDEIRATGYKKQHLGFLVAAGYSSPAEVLKFWMSSQSRIHILDNTFTEVGIGYVHQPASPYGHYWVMVLGGGESQAGATVIKREITTKEQQTDFHKVIVVPGETVENIDFGNIYSLSKLGSRLGKIQGTKWNDLNGDGVRDQNEPGLEGVTIYLDLNENGVLDKDEPTQITDKIGRYQFTKLVPKTYLVREVIPTGYQQTFPIGK